MTFDLFMSGIAPILIGILMLVFRRQLTEEIVREQTAIWRDWQWGAKHRPFTSALLNTCAVIFVLFGVFQLAGIWR